MKRILSILMIAMLLAGCAAAPSDDALIPYDAHFPADQSYLGGYLSTPNVLFCVAMQRVYFCPTGDTEFYPLCGKPDCDHTTKNCNAWLESGLSLGYHKGRLYSVVSSQTGSAQILISMDLTGADHRDELELPVITYSNGEHGSASAYEFHENRLIYMMEAADTYQPYEEQIGKIVLVDLDTLELTEAFSELMAQHAQADFYPKAVGSCLYARVRLPQPDGSVEQWLMELNMDTDETRKLVRFEGVNDWYAEEDTLYWFKHGEGFMEYDVKTGALRNRCLPADDLFFAGWTDDLICGCCMREDWMEGELYFFSRDYTLLDQLSLTDGVFPCRYGDDRILFTDPSAPLIHMPTCWLDCADVGSGKLLLHKLGE